MSALLGSLGGGLTTIVGFLLVLTVIVFIHEMGHFLVARWCGVTVKTFSIGFGKELYGWDDRYGTHWRVAAIPLGGYVKFIDDANAASAGASPEALKELSAAEKAGAFQLKPLWQRSAVVAAGPLANFLLAIVVYSGLNAIYGVRMAPPVISSVIADMPAAAAGLKAGDHILSVGGTSVETFDDVINFIAVHGSRELDILVDRNGAKLLIPVKPNVEDVKNDLNLPMQLGDIGIRRYQEARVGLLREGFPAEKAGLKLDDLITSIDGQPIDGFDKLGEIIGASAGKEIRLSIDREGKAIDIAVTPVSRPSDGPDKTKQVGRIGIGPVPLQPQAVGLFTSIRLGVRETWSNVTQTLSGLSEMIAGRQSASQIGGPILMAEVTGKAIDSGVESLMKLLAYFSVSIGLLNLFPIPVLDGGHLMFYAIEAIRRRPLPPAVQDAAFRFGFAVLLTLIVFANYNDIVRKAKGLFPGVG